MNKTSQNKDTTRSNEPFGSNASSSDSEKEQIPDYSELKATDGCCIKTNKLSPTKEKQETSVISHFETENFDTEVFTLDKTNLRYMEIGVKLVAVFILMIFIWYFGSGASQRQKSPNFCLDDRGHDYLNDLNAYIHENDKTRHFLQITSSLFMDSVLVNVLLHFLVYDQNGYGFYMTIMFYGLRGIVQSIFTYRFPRGGIWDDPGVLSITTPYGLTCDFYISGHCGFTAANAYYMWMIGRKKTSIYLMIGCCYLAFVLILFRIHYTLDIPIGIFFGIYSARITLLFYRKADKVLRNVIGRRILWMYDW